MPFTFNFCMLPFFSPPSAQTTIVGLFYHSMNNYYKEISPVKTRYEDGTTPS